jgi:hypothetical protein
MGGKGSGGARPGAGRKPKSAVERAITGNPGRRGRLLPHPSAVPVPGVAPIDEFDAPNDLSPDERNVWLELAPFAFAARTLTRATSFAFRLLCKNIVLERLYAASVADKGGANHRGLQRVDAELLAFNLRPCGKAILEAEPAQPDKKTAKRSYW